MVIDEGSFVVTDRRGVFMVQKPSCEFQRSKVLSCQVVKPADSVHVLYLPVSGHEKISAIGTDSTAMKESEQWVPFATALVTG